MQRPFDSFARLNWRARIETRIQVLFVIGFMIVSPALIGGRGLKPNQCSVIVKFF